MYECFCVSAILQSLFRIRKYAVLPCMWFCSNQLLKVNSVIIPRDSRLLRRCRSVLSSYADVQRRTLIFGFQHFQTTRVSRLQGLGRQRLFAPRKRDQYFVSKYRQRTTSPHCPTFRNVEGLSTFSAFGSKNSTVADSKTSRNIAPPPPSVLARFVSPRLLPFPEGEVEPKGCKI